MSTTKAAAREFLAQNFPEAGPTNDLLLLSTIREARRLYALDREIDRMNEGDGHGN